MTDRYAAYTRLKFDRPHPKVLRITMDNGKMNSADQAMHDELGRIWRDIDTDPDTLATFVGDWVMRALVGDAITLPLR